MHMTDTGTIEFVGELLKVVVVVLKRVAQDREIGESLSGLYEAI